MNIETNTPDFDSLADALARLKKNIEPSEIHGTLCGLLCTSSHTDSQSWISSVMQNEDKQDLTAKELTQQLYDLYTFTLQQLNDPTCDFHLLLPDDDSNLEQLLHSLSNWCQGFLLGLSQGDVKDYKLLPDDSAELVQDIVEIARAETSYTLEGTEEDENAFHNLLEYIRVGVLLINEELHPSHAAPMDSNTKH